MLVVNAQGRTMATFWTAAPALTLSGEHVGQQIYGIRPALPPTDGGITENTLDHTLRAELRTTAALGGVCETDVEGQVRETAEVSGGEEIREEKEKPGARTNVATFVAVILDVTLM